MFALGPEFYDEIADRLFKLLDKRISQRSTATTSANDTDTLLTVAEAAKRLKRCNKTVLAKIRSGVIRASNIGTLDNPQWRINKLDLDNYFKCYASR